MTSYVTGTASNAADLFSKLTTFLTTDATLTAASQNWTQVWTAGGDVVLKGPGLAGTDNVLVGFRLVTNVPLVVNNLMIEGMSGVLSGATALEGHVNPSPLVGMYLDVNPMTYWFVASGRRFIVVVQISTVFEVLYGGLFYPYGTPDQYSVPLFVGGTRGVNITGVNSWRSDAPEHTAFTSPQAAGTASSSSAYLLDPMSDWQVGINAGPSPNPTFFMVGPEQMGGGYGAQQTNAGAGPGYNDMRQWMREGVGGDYALTPMTLAQSVPTDLMLGIFDGVSSVAGYDNAAGNIVTIGGQSYLVVQNCFRAGLGNLFCVALG